MKTEITEIQIGGIDERALAAAGGGDVRNMRLDDAGRWRTSYGNGCALTKAGDTPIAETLSWARVDSVTTWGQHGNRRRWIVFEAVTYDGEGVVNTGDATLMCATPGVPATPTTIASRSQTRTGSWLFPVGEWLWIVNGVDRPIRWDGHRTEVIGFSSPPAAPRVRTVLDGLVVPRDPMPPVALGTKLYDDARARGVGPSVINPGGTGSANERFQFWRFGYQVAYVNDLGQEGPRSAITWAVGYNSATDYSDPEVSRTLVVVDLDDAPPEVCGVRLYRTSNLAPVEDAPIWESYSPWDPALRNLRNLEWQSAAPVHLLAELAGGVGLSYVDGAPDAELGPPPPMTGLVPSRVHLGAYFAGRVYLCDDDGVVWLSEVARPEQFGGLRFELGQRATAILAAGGLLFVWTSTRTYMVRPTAAEPVLEQVSSTYGCVGPRACADVPGLGVVFLDVSGPRVLARPGELFGGAVVVGPLDGPPGERSRIARTWGTARSADLERAVVAVHVPDREVWIYAEAEALGVQVHLVYHYDVGRWTRRDGMRITSAASLLDDRRLLIYGSGTQDLGVRVVCAGYDEDEAGDQVVGRVETSALLGPDFRMTTPLEIVVQHEASNRAVVVELLRDAAESWEEVGTLGESSDALAGYFVRPGFGTATWTVDEAWTSYPEVLERVSVDAWAAHMVRVAIEGEQLALTRIGVGVGASAADGKLAPLRGGG